MRNDPLCVCRPHLRRLDPAQDQFGERLADGEGTHRRHAAAPNRRGLSPSFASRTRIIPAICNPSAYSVSVALSASIQSRTGRNMLYSASIPYLSLRKGMDAKAARTNETKTAK